MSLEFLIKSLVISENYFYQVSSTILCDSIHNQLIMIHIKLAHFHLFQAFDLFR